MNDHRVIEIVELNDAAVGTDTAATTEEEQLHLTGIQLPAPPVNPDAASFHDKALTHCFDQINGLLREAPRCFLVETSPHTIVRIPQPLRGINPKAEKPEIVSIGPYHRNQPQVLAFEKLKPLFLERFLRRMGGRMEELRKIVAFQESSARHCYSEQVDMEIADFTQMMLLDCCFVLELLLLFFESGTAADEVDLIFAQPQIIPILLRDLLKLENQIPYFLLQSLFNSAVPSTERKKTGSLGTLALKFFDQAYPRPMAPLKSWGDCDCEHLLDLFYLSLKPTSGVYPHYTKEKWPSAQSVPCVTELRPSGIKFKSRSQADSFLDISFQKPLLRIPGVPINDFMTTVLINCVSLEHCRKNRSKYMTDYASFMHCLINQPKDVSLLRSDGIIAPFSHDDQYVANLFDKLAKCISFNVHDCFLSEQFEELQLYYHSNWATMRRTYFSSPWSFISAFSAFLLIVLTIIQTVIGILTYCSHR
ncbi:hypothetical protein BT93_C1860 [Corymbia citriodora subsp. variegata]|nr:hypothetical protein BT93_C1860 [Corymbia citriodora subsp. variegata]